MSWSMWQQGYIKWMMLWSLSLSACVVAQDGTGPRQTIYLNGKWQIAQGNDTQIPDKSEFTHQVPVPGLADMAEPGFQDMQKTDSREPNSSHWYRRTSTVEGDIPPVAMLKISKAKYGCSAYLNGRHVGDGARCFTPHYFDVADFLKGNREGNEQVVRVGATRQHLMVADVLTGADKEKTRYIPGIYDSVSLILTEGTFYIENVQTAMDPATKTLIISPTVINHGDRSMIQINMVIREAKTGTVAARTVIALGPDTGIKQWQDESVVVLFSLIADQGKLVFHEGNGLVCLDLMDGNVFWQRTVRIGVSKLVTSAASMLLPLQRSWIDSSIPLGS